MGSDWAACYDTTGFWSFQSTPPAWGATPTPNTFKTRVTTFQSTPPAWGATNQSAYCPDYPCVSIHAPRMGSDAGVCPRGARQSSVSIHAPRMGSDARLGAGKITGCQFQSTPPAWGATLSVTIFYPSILSFNPRPPHGERRGAGAVTEPGAGFNPRPPHGERPSKHVLKVPFQSVSIHAPRMGSDENSPVVES